MFDNEWRRTAQETVLETEEHLSVIWLPILPSG